MPSLDAGFISLYLGGVDLVMKTEGQLIFSLLGGARFGALKGVDIRCKDLCLIGRLKGREYSV